MCVSHQSSTSSSSSSPSGGVPGGVPAFEPPSWELLYDPAAVERRVQPLLSEPAIGIDIEWRPTFVAGKGQNPVALLQLVHVIYDHFQRKYHY